MTSARAVHLGLEVPPAKTARPHDRPTVMAVEWAFGGSHQSGLPFFSMWPSHVAWMDSTEAWFCEGESKIMLTSSVSTSVQALIKPPFCITVDDVPLATASHMAKPRLGLGRNGTPQEPGILEASWFVGGHMPSGTLKFCDPVLVFFCVSLTLCHFLSKAWDVTFFSYR